MEAQYQNSQYELPWKPPNFCRNCINARHLRLSRSNQIHQLRAECAKSDASTFAPAHLQFLLGIRSKPRIYSGCTDLRQ
jgi:hypothetical protein